MSLSPGELYEGDLIIATAPGELVVLRSGVPTSLYPHSELNRYGTAVHRVHWLSEDELIDILSPFRVNRQNIQSQQPSYNQQPQSNTQVAVLEAQMAQQAKNWP